MEEREPVVPVQLDPVQLAMSRTPARILVGRAGVGYRTATSLRLREDHAAARDAADAEADLVRDFGAERVASFGMFEVVTRVASKAEYLLRPDQGRLLSAPSRDQVRAKAPAGADLQVFIGDGLSASAIARQAPGLLDRLGTACRNEKWSFGTPFLVKYCRVGVMNEVGEILNPVVVVLLIGERPGLATAESLSAYMAFRPRKNHTDADRNLISNIHDRGVSLDAAAERIMALARAFRAEGRSGVGLTECELAPAIGAAAVRKQ